MQYRPRVGAEPRIDEVSTGLTPLADAVHPADDPSLWSIRESMATSNDNSGKGPPKPAVEPPKKPTAVIDLSPTEVAIKDPAKEAAKEAAKDAPRAAATVGPASAGSVPSAGPAAGAGAPATDKPAASNTGSPTKPGSSAGPSSTAPSTSASSSASAATAASPPSSARSATSPPAAGTPPKVTGGWLRGAATHLVAGLAGGLLALLGADTLMPHLQQTLGRGGDATRALEARVQQVESVVTSRPAVPPETLQRLATAEQRLIELARVAKATADQQTQLADETKALGERIAQPPPATAASGASEERVARLEQILETLKDAAAADTQRGRIAQLAGISAKLTDLEASVATQVTQLRKSVTQEVDNRLAQSSDAAQAARAGTQRLDRELSGVKNETAQLGSRMDALRTQADRLDAGMKTLREETATLKSDLGTVRDELGRELRQVARPTDVTTALSPVASKLAALEQNVQGVVRGEDDRRANIERIVTALELGNLKRSIERGGSFGAELAEVRRVAGPRIDLGVLERYKDRGVPSTAELERDLRTIAFSIIDADKQPANASWSDRLIASAKSVVRVRRVDQGADDQSVEAVVARMEAGLKSGRLADVTREAAKLSEQARAPARAWLEKVEARAAVERALAAIEQELKASLGAVSQPGRKG
jgi:hypothetical protein